MDVPQPTDQDGQREPAEQSLTTTSAPADTPGSPEHPTPVVTRFGWTVKPNPSPEFHDARSARYVSQSRSLLAANRSVKTRVRRCSTSVTFENCNNLPACLFACLAADQLHSTNPAAQSQLPSTAPIQDAGWAQTDQLIWHQRKPS
ncbi:hypothetical protein SRHO_G00250930 [Serrasalmus rhombeus]